MPVEFETRVLADRKPCGLLGESCGLPELPWRDAGDALEVIGELALVGEAGVRSDLLNPIQCCLRGGRIVRDVRRGTYDDRFMQILRLVSRVSRRF